MPFEYAIYSPADAAEMVPLLAEAFTSREPLATAVGVTVPDFQQFVGLLLPNAAADPLTTVARDAATGELVGVMLTEDSASPMPEGIDSLSPAFQPIFDLLHELEVEHRGGAVPGPGEWLHLFLLAVKKEATGQGIAQQLVSRSIENGARRGYRRAVAECTNPTSQHVFRKVGFTERVRRSYADYDAFRSVAWAGGTILMEKQL